MLKKLYLIACVYISAFSFLHAHEQTTLLLIRHGETDANVQRIYLGQTNVPLNEKGTEQAKQLAHYLADRHPDITAIYSSDLLRAYATAQHTSDLFNLPISPKSNLREMHFGAAEGIVVEKANELYQHHQLLADYPSRKERWDLPLFPHGESCNQLLLRASEELISIAKAHPGKKIAIFSHGKLIKTLVSESLDSDDAASRFPNCGIACFTFVPEDPTSPLVFLETEEPFSVANNSLLMNDR